MAEPEVGRSQFLDEKCSEDPELTKTNPSPIVPVAIAGLAAPRVHSLPSFPPSLLGEVLLVDCLAIVSERFFGPVETYCSLINVPKPYSRYGEHEHTPSQSLEWSKTLHSRLAHSITRV